MASVTWVDLLLVLVSTVTQGLQTNALSDIYEFAQSLHRKLIIAKGVEHCW